MIQEEELRRALVPLIKTAMKYGRETAGTFLPVSQLDPTSFVDAIIAAVKRAEQPQQEPEQQIAHERQPEGGAGGK